MSINPKPRPCCGKPATSWGEDAGWDWLGNNLYHACAARPDCDAGIDLYVEESTDPDAGEELEREAVTRWNRRTK